MCGIVGIVRTGDAPLPHASVLRSMMASIEYRGPSDSGEFLSGDVQLGVVRLAIVDPKNGSQPVFGCERGPVGVYNGEIYNHYPLRKGLGGRGHRLASQADTEVLPHLYEDYGGDFVNHLRGMFALAIWDQSERRVLLARDRMGIKPLFYAKTDDYLLFASEVKAIVSSGLIRPEIDRDSLDDLFSLSYPFPPRTMLAGVRELLPAHVMEIRAGRRECTTRKYWALEVPPKGEHRRISRSAAAEELRSLLKAKVYEHMSADVPVAAYLSGGLDSSSIAALMKDVTGDPPATFSISFSSPEFDESKFAAAMADRLGSPTRFVQCESEAAADFEKMIWHTELPLQFPLALPLMRLAGQARQDGFPVVLTGEGADEIFGGYDCFRADKMRRMLDRPGLRFLRPQVYKQLYKWHQLPEGTVKMMLENHQQADAITRNFGGVLPPWYDIWTTVGIERERLLCGVDGRRVRPVEEPPLGFDERLPSDLDRLHPLDAGIALEQATRLPSWILLIGDRASMSQGVEARVPFLDHEVVEFVASLPPSLKMSGFQEKSALRNAMRPLLPVEIARRQKRPFFTPIREWFFSDDSPDLFRDLLSAETLDQYGLFDPGTVARFLRELRLVPRNHLLRSRLEWTLILVLGTQLFYRQFVRDVCMKPPIDQGTIGLF